MTKLFIYPFTVQTCTVFFVLQDEYPALFQKFDVFGIVPNANYIPNISILKLRNRKCDKNIKLISLEELSKIGEGIFLQLFHNRRDPIRKFVIKVRRYVKDRKIIVYDSVNEFLEKQFPERQYKQFTPVVKPEQSALVPIRIPVVGVCAAFPFLDSTEVITELKKNMMRELNISIIYTNKILRSWKCNYIDIDLIESNSFENKLFCINQYANEVILSERPDVLLVEIPDAVIAVNPRNLFGGGQYPFVFSQAIGFDYTICCVPANDIASYSFSYLKKYLETHYAMRHIAFHVANSYYFLEKESFNGAIPSTFVDDIYITRGIIEARKKDPQIHIYNMLDRNEFLKWRTEK